MHFHAVLNRDGGTLSTRDIGEFSNRLDEIMRAAGHSIEIHAVRGRDIVGALQAAVDSENSEVVLVAGGDGTVSLAAGLLADTNKTLAILPAGTMNLFARSLGIPLDPETAAEALAAGCVRRVDMARANGRPFVHQFSIGMHPRLIHLRSQIPFKGRFGKLLASARAAIATLLRPPNLEVALFMGDTEVIAATSGISVTNNLYGEGHLPFADQPDGGVLGVYITQAQSRLELIAFFLNMAWGRWRKNDQVEIHEADEVRLEILSLRPRLLCSMDGELRPLEKEVVIRLHPKCLAVLVPAEGLK